MKLQLDDVFNEENRKRCNKYHININLLMKMTELVISVLSNDYKTVETVIEEINNNFNEFKVLVDELLNLKSVILDIEKVKQVQFFISIISFVTSEIFISLSKAGIKKNIPVYLFIFILLLFIIIGKAYYIITSVIS